MPTKHPRHSITETGAVAEALRRLRERNGSKVDLAELVVLGVEEKLRLLEAEQADEERRRELRMRFARRSLNAEGIDPEAAIEVRERGWHHE